MLAHLPLSQIQLKDLQEKRESPLLNTARISQLASQWRAAKTRPDDGFSWGSKRQNANESRTIPPQKNASRNCLSTFFGWIVNDEKIQNEKIQADFSINFLLDFE